MNWIKIYAILTTVACLVISVYVKNAHDMSENALKNIYRIDRAIEMHNTDYYEHNDRFTKVEKRISNAYEIIESNFDRISVLEKKMEK